MQNGGQRQFCQFVMLKSHGISGHRQFAHDIAQPGQRGAMLRGRIAFAQAFQRDINPLGFRHHGDAGQPTFIRFALKDQRWDYLFHDLTSSISGLFIDKK
ncbi:hypothetical protein L580_3940 [Serratia fonticola AU-P3(3)]|nr:hypothetical protein L580_3940 [Serratia fonticola AU-P3(3)]